jgi:hypothetical protein
MLLHVMYREVSARRRAQSVGGGGGVNPNLLQPSEFDVSGILRAPILSPCSLPVGEAISPTFEPTRDLIRRVLFLNDNGSRYVSEGFYPVLNDQVFVEFGGPRITPISLLEQHMKTLWDNLPKLCDDVSKRYPYL